MPSPYSNQIRQLEDERDRVIDRLSSSPTAYSGVQAPTNSDLKTDAELTSVNNALEQLRSKQIRERWYGKEQDEGFDSQKEEGVISRVLNALARPVYAATGAAEWAVGKGSRSGFFENINQNMKERESFGHLLEKVGAPKIVSIPLGFALDIASDPINWATAGTAALLPRVGYGLVKGTAKEGVSGGLRAAAKGFESGLEKNVSKVASLIPFMGSSKAVKKLSGKAVASYEDYLKSIGQFDDAIKHPELAGQDIGEGLFGFFNLADGRTIGAALEDKLRDLPGGEDIIRAFKYSSGDFTKASRLREQVQRLLEEKQGLSTGAALQRQPMRSAEEMIQGARTGSRGEQLAQDVMEETRAGDFVAHNPDVARADTFENARRLLDEAGIDYDVRDLVRAYDDVAYNKTGIKAYDDMVERAKDFKIKDVPFVKKLLDFYDAYIGVFKLVKVPGSPAAYANAVVGNPIMALMAGVDITRPEYLQRLTQMAKVVYGKAGPNVLLKSLFDDAAKWSDFMNEYPMEFSRAYGFSPRFAAAKFFSDQAMQAGKGLGMVTQKNVTEFRKSFKNAIDEARKEMENVLAVGEDVTRKKTKLDELKSQIRDLEKSFEKSDTARIQELRTSAKALEDEISLRETAGRSFKQAKIPKVSPLGDVQQRIAAGEVIRTSELPAGWAANELLQSEALNRWRTFVRTKAETTGDLGYRALNAIINKSSSLYEGIDQSSRLGLAVMLANDGLSLEELKKVGRLVRVDPNIDLLSKYSKRGEYYYRLSPAKATEVANEVYMNYAAMPGAVKVLRSLPLLGSPFSSFMYGMLAKTGKTMVHNPAAFNRVNLLLNEMSGVKSPLEKESLQSKYNAYLNSPGMVRLPFFQENPIYMNVASMIPYYTMNMFVPPERKYQETLPSQITSVLDRMPIFKDPVGQLLFDYFVQPALLQREAPQGYFGQPLYPSDASIGEKAIYAGRQATETIMPGVAGYLGFATPQEFAEYMPSYRWRQIAYAKAGKDPLGAKTKESALQRSIRAALSTAGIQLHPLELTYLTNQVKKGIK